METKTLATVIDRLNVGDVVRVTFGVRTPWHKTIRRPDSVVGVVAGFIGGGLDLTQPGDPRARYGVTGSTWGRVFYAGSKGILASIAGAPPYQATVIGVQKEAKA